MGIDVANPKGSSGRCLFLVICGLFFLICHSHEEEKKEEKKEQLNEMDLEVHCFFSEVWRDYFNAVKQGCYHREGSRYRTECNKEVVEMSVAIVMYEQERIIADNSAGVACANGVLNACMIAMMASEMKCVPLARKAMAKIRLLDASRWPIKYFDAVEILEDTAPKIQWKGPILDGKRDSETETRLVLNDITAVVVKFSEIIGETLKDMGLNVLTAPKDAMTTGESLNRLLRSVSTPLVLIVGDSLVPRSAEDIRHLVELLYKFPDVKAVSYPMLRQPGSVSSSARHHGDELFPKVFSRKYGGKATVPILVNMCYRIEMLNWRISFESDMENTIDPTYKDFTESTSVRGSHLFDVVDRMTHGPCKLCEGTIASTFVAQTEEMLHALPFSSDLDGDWAMLDWFAGKPFRVGTTAQCMSSWLIEIAPAARLFGVADEVEPWFNSRESRGSMYDVEHNIGPEFSVENNAQRFMEMNELKEFLGLDKKIRHFGCTMATRNCPMAWSYQGYTIPPCCLRTLKNLLFFIEGFFMKHQIRYIVTDGALLGALKTGKLLQWDADIDLHVENESFERLTQLMPLIKEAGYHARMHVNGLSILLTANEHNYLLVELNKRPQPFPDDLWMIELEDHLFPVMANPVRNISEWYGEGFLPHRVRYASAWDIDEGNNMPCQVPGHHNCANNHRSGKDCRWPGGLCANSTLSHYLEV